mmetsp:Transcript_17528/g.26245  ORF Transcript_17528/g.26245 Transcript_17528/m.26245 type:complete len:119 (+) Transcript_17528:1724-2080(+)
MNDLDLGIIEDGEEEEDEDKDEGEVKALMGNRPVSKRTTATKICPMLERTFITKTNIYSDSAPLTLPKLFLISVIVPPAERDLFATSKEFLTKIKISCVFLTQSFTMTIVVKAIDTKK